MKAWLSTTLEALNLVEHMNQLEGFTRLGYTEEEFRAMEVFTQIATELGLDVQIDAAGNRIARWNVTANDASRSAIAFGSHLDTVPNGGGYDGVAGVLCALGAIKKLKEEQFAPSHPLEVICFASEESSRFGISTIGSKAMAGILPLNELEHVPDEEGITIRQAVEGMGLEWSKIVQAERPQNAIKSFIELHIEQGNWLNDQKAHFGAVKAIACPIRLKIKVIGRSGHTGTTPMNKRCDALVAIAPLITYISERAEEITLQEKQNLVATVSTISLVPNAMSVIPEQVDIGIDIRSVSDELKERIVQNIRAKCTLLEERFGVQIIIDTLVNNTSVHLAKPLVDKLQSAGEELGYKSFVMDSGAGHDVMNMAQKWDAGLIFIPCKDGISHHPAEFASLRDLQIGVEILTSYIKGEQAND